MLILIVSDSHDHWTHLARAVTLGNERGCEVLLHAGDFISPPGVETLATFKGLIHVVWGNNEGEKVGMLHAMQKHPHITHHGDVMDVGLGNVRFYMNHYPHIAENAALSEKYDVVVFGHTHQYHEGTVPNGTLLLNPGELQGYRTGISTAMIFNTDTRSVERIIIS
jgi:putative phosphoesterase